MSGGLILRDPTSAPIPVCVVEDFMPLTGRANQPCSFLAEPIDSGDVADLNDVLRGFVDSMTVVQISGVQGNAAIVCSVLITSVRGLEVSGFLKSDVVRATVANPPTTARR
jgi:hypothetical protein